MKLRTATIDDVASISSIDEVCQSDSKRFKLIQKAISVSEAYVILDGDGVVGYAILSHNFFQRPFVEMLYVARSSRRQGFGEQALTTLESLTEDRDEIWTSTNRSNLAMQSLLEKLGYVKEGEVELDRGDPEIFYRKQLT